MELDKLERIWLRSIILRVLAIVFGTLLAIHFGVRIFS